MEKLINALLLPKCSVCGTRALGVCEACLGKIKPCTTASCIVCGLPSIDGKTHVTCYQPHFPLNLFCAFLYEGVVQDVVIASKCKQAEFYSLKILSRRAGRFCAEAGYLYSSHLVVPVPLSTTVMKERGFNQSELIARAISNEFGLKFHMSLLQRLGSINSVENPRIKRPQVFEDTFSVKKGAELTGVSVLLVDDICVTGGTFLMAAKALFLAGAEMVNCFALSKKVL